MLKFQLINSYWCSNFSLYLKEKFKYFLWHLNKILLDHLKIKVWLKWFSVNWSQSSVPIYYWDLALTNRRQCSVCLKITAVPLKWINYKQRYEIHSMTRCLIASDIRVQSTVSSCFFFFFSFSQTPVLSSGNGPQEEKGRSQDGNGWWQEAAGLSEEASSEQHRRNRGGEHQWRLSSAQLHC